jgi:hypothetical protein
MLLKRDDVSQNDEIIIEGSKLLPAIGILANTGDRCRGMYLCKV